MTDDSDIRRARALARALDSAVGVPGTRIRVGLDAILGLIPGGGDVAGAALSGYIVLAAARRSAPPAVIARMLLNILVDSAIGSVPLLGDLFDVAFKANLRNADLLEKYSAAPSAVSRRSRWLVVAVVLALLVLVLGIGTLSVLLARAAWSWLAA
jgi:hypothetical protein